MSKSFLPPVAGEPPTKVVFEGVEPGSPAAQRLYFENSGAIARFHQRARQAREISGQRGAQMHQALPGGGRMTYSFNDGIEIVHVRLSPQVVVPAPAEVLIPAVPKVLAPTLAIDVLFLNELFLAGDVYSKTVETTTEDQWIWVEGDPIPIDPDDPAMTKTIYSLQDVMAGWNGDGAGEAPGAHWEATGGTVVVATDGFFAGNVLTNPYRSEFPSFPPTNDNINIRIFTEVETTGPFVGPFGGPTPWSDFIGFAPGVGPDTIDAPYRKIFVRTFESTWARSDGGFQPTWIGSLGPPITIERNMHLRDQVSFFDVLTAVGLRVRADPDDPGSLPYEAVSVVPASDDRLRPLSFEPAAKTATRALVAADTPAPGLVGEGFVALPQTAPILGDTAPRDTVIDVYVSSTNMSKENEYPGPAGATFEVDDPSFTYDFKEDVSWTVRVREFVDESPLIVGVTTTTERRDKHWTATAPDTEPTVEGPNEDRPSSRTAEWSFAAADAWSDQGGEPADPNALTAGGKRTMGKLLGETSGSTSVVGPSPLGRAIREQPFWTGSVEGMTRIATITWSPPTEEHAHGTAAVEPA